MVCKCYVTCERYLACRNRFLKSFHQRCLTPKANPSLVLAKCKDWPRGFSTFTDPTFRPRMALAYTKRKYFKTRKRWSERALQGIVKVKTLRCCKIGAWTTLLAKRASQVLHQASSTNSWKRTCVGSLMAEPLHRCWKSTSRKCMIWQRPLLSKIDTRRTTGPSLPHWFSACAARSSSKLFLIASKRLIQKRSILLTWERSSATSMPTVTTGTIMTRVRKHTTVLTMPALTTARREARVCLPPVHTCAKMALIWWAGSVQGTQSSRISSSKRRQEVQIKTCLRVSALSLLSDPTSRLRDPNSQTHSHLLGWR